MANSLAGEATGFPTKEEDLDAAWESLRDGFPEHGGIHTSVAGHCLSAEERAACYISRNRNFGQGSESSTWASANLEMPRARSLTKRSVSRPIRSRVLAGEFGPFYSPVQERPCTDRFRSQYGLSRGHDIRALPEADEAAKATGYYRSKPRGSLRAAIFNPSPPPTACTERTAVPVQPGG